MIPPVSGSTPSLTIPSFRTVGDEGFVSILAEIGLSLPVDPPGKRVPPAPATHAPASREELAEPAPPVPDPAQVPPLLPAFPGAGPADTGATPAPADATIAGTEDPTATRLPDAPLAFTTQVIPRPVEPASSDPGALPPPEADLRHGSARSALADTSAQPDAAPGSSPRPDGPTDAASAPTRHAPAEKAPLSAPTLRPASAAIRPAQPDNPAENVTIPARKPIAGTDIPPSARPETAAAPMQPSLSSTGHPGPATGLSAPAPSTDEVPRPDGQTDIPRPQTGTVPDRSAQATPTHVTILPPSPDLPPDAMQPVARPPSPPSGPQAPPLPSAEPHPASLPLQRTLPDAAGMAQSAPPASAEPPASTPSVQSRKPDAAGVAQSASPLPAEPRASTPAVQTRMPDAAGVAQSAAPASLPDGMIPPSGLESSETVSNIAQNASPLAASRDPAALPGDQRPLPLPPNLPADLLRLAQAGPHGPVHLTLRPEELGTLRFEMTRQAEGMHIHLAVDQPATLDLLRRHADLILAELRQSGFAGLTLSYGQDGGGGEAREGRPAPPPSAPPPDGGERGGWPAAPRPAAAGNLDLRL